MEIFECCHRSVGDLAGVFEYDGQTGYFYLYEICGEVEKKILDAIRIVVGPVDFTETDVGIVWSANEKSVGLSIRGTIWAVFDTVSKQKHGGNYRHGGHPDVPDDIAVWSKA